MSPLLGDCNKRILSSRNKVPKAIDLIARIAVIAEIGKNTRLPQNCALTRDSLRFRRSRAILAIKSIALGTLFRELSIRLLQSPNRGLTAEIRRLGELPCRVDAAQDCGGFDRTRKTTAARF